MAHGLTMLYLRYIRVVGTRAHNEDGNAEFGLISLEASYSSRQPEMDPKSGLLGWFVCSSTFRCLRGAHSRTGSLFFFGACGVVVVCMCGLACTSSVRPSVCLPACTHDGRCTVVARENEATLEREAVVVGGVLGRSAVCWAALLDGDTQHYDDHKGFTGHMIGGSDAIVVHLPQPVLVDSMRSASQQSLAYS